MPFFIRRQYPNKKTNPSTTLQVRIPNQCKKKKTAYVKRVLLSASFSGSLTVEAAFCLAFMVFAMVILILPMKIMDTRRQLQAGLETVCEELSRYAYIEYQLRQGDSQGEPAGIDGADDFTKALTEQIFGGLVEGYAQSAVSEWIDTGQIRNLSMKRSSVLADGETLDLILDYEIELPFPILVVTSIPQSVRSCRRAWIGKAGEELAGELLPEQEDRIVYIGKSSTRYHDRSDCHYLSNRLTSALLEQVAEMRNESGGRYHPCSACGAGAAGGSLVYVMPSGSRYHTQPHCSTIVAYVQSVKLSEVAHLGGCSYCTN